MEFYRSRWTPSRFRAIWAITSHTLGEIAKKLKKVAPSISKSQNSQKSWNFLARDERPRNSLRFEPPQAILWVKKKIWIFSRDLVVFGFFWIFKFQLEIPFSDCMGSTRYSFRPFWANKRGEKKIFRTFCHFYLIKKKILKSAVLSSELKTMRQSSSDDFWKWTLKRVLFCKSKTLAPRAWEIWLLKVDLEASFVI